MTHRRGLARICITLFLGLGLARSCAFDVSIREYLDAHFWLPYSKLIWNSKGQQDSRVYEPYAGTMDEEDASEPLKKLRDGYSKVLDAEGNPYVSDALRQSLASAQADKSLSAKEREEVTLVDAKIDMRAAEPDDDIGLRTARKKLQQFVRSSRYPEFRSEARGWIAHIDYLLGDQTAAGKIYLDELSRADSNLTRTTLMNSLQMTYGYDGGPDLLKHLDAYFDTPEHAAFAVQLVTNPRWNPTSDAGESEQPEDTQRAYARIKQLLRTHSDLLKSDSGADLLANLEMRTALRMGDPEGALQTAAEVPESASVRADPDFNWMLAGARYLTHDFAEAEQPLLNLFNSSKSTPSRKASAAYGLCGVYSKIGNTIEEIRFAVWLHTQPESLWGDYPGEIADQSIYWAESGFDLSLLLEYEASTGDLKAFLTKYPNDPGIRIVRYSLAVRLARDNQYDEAAQIYASINAGHRASRMQRLAQLYADTTAADATPAQVAKAKYQMAEFLSANPERIYFNDALWKGMERYALVADTDDRLTRAERESHIADERKLRDDQEERWRAYLLLREVIDEEGKTTLGRNAAQLAIRCLSGINTGRFGRADEIRKADIELSKWLGSTSSAHESAQVPRKR